MAGDKGLQADNGIWIELGLGGVNRTDGKVVDREILCGFELSSVVGGETEASVWTNDGASLGGRQICLADMKAQAKQSCVVGPVVENQVRLSNCATLEGLYKIACKSTLMTDLDPVCATIDRGLQAVCQTVAVQMGGIKDRVEHYSWIRA